MKHLEAGIEIKAEPDRVWEVLIDFASYPAWNPFIVSLEGKAAVGEKLREVIRMPDGKEVRLTSKIVSMVPGQQLVWEGFLGAPFLFLGKHEFILKPVSEGTRFTQREAFTGLFLPAFSVDAALPGYHHMNRALKARVEG